MGFLETVRRARTYLAEQRRVSLRALELEFELGEAQLEALVQELADVQRVAVREPGALAWAGSSSHPERGAERPASGRVYDPRDYTPKHLADNGRQSGGRLFEMDALLTRARALVRSEGPGGAAEAGRTLEEVSKIIDETEAHCRAPLVHEVSAELAHARGDAAGRERHLREAHRLHAPMGATGQTERLARETGTSPP